MLVNLRRACTAATVFSVVSAGAALAQDWSGAYYGGTLGFGAGEYQQGVAALDETGVEVDVNGLIYGGHAGINLQSGRLIYGVDAGLSSGPTGSSDQGTTGEDFSCLSGDCDVNINYIGTLRARVGYVVDVRTYVYGAAGLAVADVDGGIANSPQSGGSTTTGFTYALGVERITSPVSSIFAEMGMYDLGTLEFGTNERNSGTPPPSIEPFTADGDFLAIRAGINFKF